MKGDFKKVLFLLTTCCLATLSLPLLADSNISKIATDQAPKAIGPYSQAICAGAYVFVSGQIAIDPAIGKITTTTIEEQTAQVLKNMEAVLMARGLTLEHVVKTEVYLKDLKDFAAMNKVYAEKFSYAISPARATVQISKLPLDALIEISCTAFIPDELAQ